MKFFITIFICLYVLFSITDYIGVRRRPDEKACKRLLTEVDRHYVLASLAMPGWVMACQDILWKGK